MRKIITIIFLLILIGGVVNASIFTPKAPPPTLIVSGYYCTTSGCNFTGNINMDGNSILDAIFINATIINATSYDVLTVNGSIYADDFYGEFHGNVSGENISDVYVPYLGAIYDVDLGSHDLNASELRTQESTGGLLYLERDSSSDVDEGDRLGQISFLGRETDGGLMKVGGMIKAEGDADWNTGLYHPTRLEFFTENNQANSGMAYPRLTINSDGQIWITRDYDSLIFGNDKDITEHFDGTNRISSVKSLADDVDYYFINYTNIIFNGSNVTADYYFGSGAYLTELNVTGNVSVGGDLDMSGYRLTTSFLDGIIGGMDMRGDPWYLGGTDFEINLDLKVNNTEIENNLIVGGNVTIGGYIVGNSSMWSKDGTNIFLTDIDDNVGIGTNIPSQRLVVDSGDGDTYAYLGVRLDSDNRFIKIGNPGTDISHISVDDNDVLAFGQETLFSDNGSTFVELMRIERIGGTESPRVGIGTSNPTQTLDVNGTVIINGNTNITKTLNVANNILLGNSVGEYAYYNTTGDLYLGDGSAAIYNGQLGIWTLPYGAGLIVNNHGSKLNITSFGGTANVNAISQFICDTTNPFNSYNVDMFIEVISSVPSYEGATGVIETYVNSSCVRVSFGSADGDLIADATNMSFIVYPHPVIGIMDNGDVHFNIGNNPDAGFHVRVDNSTGDYSFLLDNIAGANNNKAFSMEVDSKNFDGVNGMNIYMYSSTGVDGIKSNAIALEGDATGFNNSQLHFIDIDLIGSGVDNDVDAIHVSPLVNHIIHIGSADVINKSYYNAVDITSNVIDVGGDVTVFMNDNDYIYFGSDINFTTLSIALSTTSSKNLGFRYFYCDAGGVWKALTGVTDTTQGFTVSGGISFSNPVDRGKCNQQFDGTPFADTINYSYIAIKRTANNIVRPPVIDMVTISGGSESFILAKDYMNLHPVDTAPAICDATRLGSIYFDVSEDDMCQCASGGWEVIRDGSVCT